jgi:hypothetical protein
MMDDLNRRFGWVNRQALQAMEKKIFRLGAELRLKRY